MAEWRSASQQSAQRDVAGKRERESTGESTVTTKSVAELKRKFSLLQIGLEDLRQEAEPSAKSAAGPLLRARDLRSSRGGVEAACRQALADGVRRYPAPELHSCHPRRPWRQIVARCTYGRSAVFASL